MQLPTVFVLFAILVQLNYACYITNCPIGGKRNLHLDNNLRSNQCPRCGHNGQCFGPSICCASQGCRIGHPLDTLQCSLENHSLIPCTIKSPICTAVPNGRCASNGVCCGTESCQIDETCLTSNHDTDSSREERLSQSRFALLR